MERLFTMLNHAIEGAPLVAVAASLVWGILSVLLSPCHLTSIPLVVGYIGRQGQVSAKRAFAISCVFALGIFVSIAAVGAITGAAGRIVGDVGPAGNYLVAAVFFLVGLYLLDVLPIPWSGAGFLGIKFAGLAAAFLLGLVFGVAVGPCTFAYMIPVLAVSFRAASVNLLYAVSLVVVYAVGHCSVIILAGTFTSVVTRYLNWSGNSRAPVIFKRVCAVLVLFGGVYIIYKA